MSACCTAGINFRLRQTEKHAAGSALATRHLTSSGTCQLASSCSQLEGSIERVFWVYRFLHIVTHHPLIGCIMLSALRNLRCLPLTCVHSGCEGLHMGQVSLIRACKLVFGRMGGEAPTYGGHRAARWDAQGFYKLLGLPTERGSDSGEQRGADMPAHLKCP